MMRSVVPGEPMIHLAAKMISRGATVHQVRAMLLRVGCIEENAFLFYTAARQLVRHHPGRR